MSPVGLPDILGSTTPIIVKLGGGILGDPAALRILADDLASFDHERPGRLVVVHGGGAIADDLLARAGFESSKIDGLRCTPPESLETIASAFRGVAGSRLSAALAAAGTNPIGLALSDGQTLRCRLKHSDRGDLGRVGEPTGGDPGFVRSLLRTGQLPVFCAMSLGADHAWLNVNADEAASEIAGVLDAAAVVLLSDVPAVLNADGIPIGMLNSGAVELLIIEQVIAGGMIPKARAAVRAARRAGCPALIASWKAEGGLAAVLSGVVTSTVVYPAARGVIA